MGGRCCAGIRSSSRAAAATTPDIAAEDRLNERFAEAAAQDLAVGHPMIRAFTLDQIDAAVQGVAPLVVDLSIEAGLPDDVPALAAGLRDDLVRGERVALSELSAPTISPVRTTIEEASHGEP